MVCPHGLSSHSHGVVPSEGFDALLEQVAETVGEKGGADAHALLRRAHGVERIDGYAVVHQLASELEVVHARILHGEIEAVGKGRTEVVVIHEVKAIGQ